MMDRFLAAIDWFAKGFAFVGPTTMFALMEAVGMVDTHVVGSHRAGPAAPPRGLGPAL